MSKQTDQRLENARLNMKIAVALSNLSASEISQKAGLSVNVLGKYMRGETMISFGNMQAVCDVLGIPLALITTSRQITPQRIRLATLIDRLNDDQIAAFLEREPGPD